MKTVKARVASSVEIGGELFEIIEIDGEWGFMKNNICFKVDNAKKEADVLQRLTDLYNDYGNVYINETIDNIGEQNNE